MKILALAIVLALSSCAVTFDPVSGTPVFTVDPDTVVLIATKGAQVVNETIIEATK